MNINEYKISKLLFIKGVYIKDCIKIDDIFEQQLLDRISDDKPIIVYNKIPSNFTDMKSWIQTINIKCWHCDLKFLGIPVFIPKIIEPSTTHKSYNIATFGCFCSFPCAMAYNNIYNHKICKNISVKEMLLLLYKIFHGVSIKEIFPAPPKYEMIHYGGKVDPMDYKTKIEDLENEMKKLTRVTFKKDANTTRI